MYDIYEYRHDTASEADPQSEPENTTSENERITHGFKTFRDCFRRTDQCVCGGLFSAGEYDQPERRNRSK